MICPFLVLAATFIPACRYANSPNHVTVNDQFISTESLFKVTCNTTGFDSAMNYDLFRISNRTAFNVTSIRSESLLSAEVNSLIGKNTLEWYCCCPGNCRDLSKNLGSIPVFVGEKPRDMITVECILKSDSTLHCNWSSNDDCIQWRVKYSSTSVHGICVSDSDTCNQQDCRSSICYLRSDSENMSLCRQCVIQLTEITPNQKLVLSFHAQNLWGGIKFNRSIYIQENINQVEELNVTSTVDTLQALWTMPILPTPFNLNANVTCLVETVCNTSTGKKFVMVNIRQKNVTLNISNLLPATNYIVQVQCKLSKSAYWSPEVMSALVSTKSDRPLSGPELEINSFICVNNSIFIYFKKMDLRKSRGLVIGYQVVTSSNFTENYTSDYLTLEIPYENRRENQTVEIYARNIKGTSLEPTSLQINTNNEVESDIVTVVVEKENNSSYVWLSIYTDPVSTTNVTTIYWCRGIISMSRIVMCQSDYNYTKPDLNMRLGLNNASDNTWKFGVALQNRPGMIWARQRCIFKCRSCVPTKGPTIPITHKDKNVPNTLILILTDDFCSQNQWLPVSYHITYYPQDDLSLVKNKTTAASPYLRRIELNDVEDNKTYNISWRISSRSLQYGKATNFSVYTGPSDLNVLHDKQVIPVKSSCNSCCLRCAVDDFDYNCMVRTNTL
ncbi:unnamed protein product [Mytilus coruscus]|uniref:Fibronectin type-III domain-containing protein n=1 Tax=Mytilus coruscus TaxID=42192 RepID=A0A6J8CQU0_MYTCO|nr:unnamed protein product [Mytilus coruscus]